MDENMDLGPEVADFDAATGHIPDTLSGAPMGGPAGVEGQPEAVQQAPSGLTVEAIAATFKQVSKFAAEGIKDGAFWELQDAEADALAKAWQPVLGPLWDRWMADTNGLLLPALLMTAVTLVPRAFQEASRRASMTASTATAKSGDSSISLESPEVENPLKQTGSSPEPIAA